MRRHAHHGRGIEPVRAVIKSRPDLVGSLAQDRVQIVFCGAGINVRRCQAPRRIQFQQRGIEREHRLKERVVARVPLDPEFLDEVFERHAVVFQGFKRCSPGPLGRFAKGRIAGQVGNQHHGIQEISEQRLRLRTAPACGDAPDRNRLLTGVAVHERREAGEQDLKYGNPFGLAECPQGHGQAVAEGKAVYPTAKCLRPGGRAVHRQVEGRQLPPSCRRQ